VLGVGVEYRGDVGVDVRGKEGSSREARIWLLSLSHGGLATHMRMYSFSEPASISSMESRASV
jgi:hypothetical protein